MEQSPHKTSRGKGRIRRSSSNKNDSSANLSGPKAASKYDFIKVRVRVKDHYYVLSRFIVSRLLAATKVRGPDAVRIALDLKKRLVDDDQLNISQRELEQLLFSVMLSYGYSNKHISRFQMLARFHQQRVPLLILIGGVGCVGKSTLAAQLASILNLSSVIQTDLIAELLASHEVELGNAKGTSEAQDGASGVLPSLNPSDPAGMPPRLSLGSNGNTDVQPPPLWFRDCDKDTLLKEYRRQCQLVRVGVEHDVRKCYSEGKSLIIEGSHIDPRLYADLHRYDHGGAQGMPPLGMGTQVTSFSVPDTPSSFNDASVELSNTALPVQASARIDVKVTSESSRGIVVTIILTMPSRDQQHLLRQWGVAREMESKGAAMWDLDSRLERNFGVISEYLQTSGVPNVQVVPVNVHSVEETLGTLQTTVLEAIESGYGKGERTPGLG